MYLWKALDLHRPKKRIWTSDEPFSAAQEAAPMQKLWPLQWDRDNEQTVDSSEEKYERDTGDRSAS